MNFKKKSYRLAVLAIAFALIFVAMMLDKLYSSFLPVSMACIVLLVTFSICLLFDDWFMAFMAGVLFGLASFCKGFIFGEATFVTFGISSIHSYSTFLLRSGIKFVKAPLLEDCHSSCFIHLRPFRRNDTMQGLLIHLYQ